ncbi:MAG: cupin domain-containing protein, partial [Pseudomonadota bacterium]
QELNKICNMTHIWTSKTMNLVLDRKIIDPQQYCINSEGRNGEKIRLPQPDLIMEWIQQGATLVLNSLDSLTEDLRCFSNMLESAFDAKVQSNLYCSSKACQAFDTHCDTHDVLAVHFIGEKIWTLWQNRAPHPINHSHFKNQEQSYIDRARGDHYTQIKMQPGDLLYIPRGWYHDALASDEYAVHIAFGMTSIIGLDMIDMIYQTMLEQQIFRKNIPHQAMGDQKLQQHLKDLQQGLNDLFEQPDFISQIRAKQKTFRYSRGGIDLPAEVTKKATNQNIKWCLTRPDIKIVKSGASYGIKVGQSRNLMPIPQPYVSALQWIVKQKNKSFSVHDILNSKTIEHLGLTQKLCADLQNMGLIRITNI